MGRAIEFYEGTFGQKLEDLHMPELDMWAFPGECDGGGATGALVKMEGKDSGGGGTIVYFSCDDCGESAEKAVEAGGEIHLKKMSIGEHGFISLINDTEGNMIGLHSME